MVLNGLDHLADAAPWLKGRRLGLITSTSGVTRMLTSGIDAVLPWKPTPIPLPDCRCTACTARIPST